MTMDEIQTIVKLHSKGNSSVSSFLILEGGKISMKGTLSYCEDLWDSLYSKGALCHQIGYHKKS